MSLGSSLWTIIYIVTPNDMVAIAQLVEHLVVAQEVTGSSPVGHPSNAYLDTEHAPFLGAFLCH